MKSLIASKSSGFLSLTNLVLDQNFVFETSFNRDRAQFLYLEYF